MPFPATPIVDNFNRPNEDPLFSYTKVSGSGQLGIVSSQVVRTQSVAAYVVKDGFILGDNQEAHFKIATPGANGSTSSLILRVTGDTFYRVGIAPGTPNWSLVLERWVSGSATPIGGSPVTVGSYSAGDIFGARITHSKIEAFINGSIIGSVTDTDIVTGNQAGFQVAASPWAIDDFGGGNYIPEGVQLSGYFNFTIRTR